MALINKRTSLALAPQYDEILKGLDALEAGLLSETEAHAMICAASMVVAVQRAETVMS